MNDKIVLSLPIETDPDGYLDRRCPWAECQLNFKIATEDWTNLVSDEAAYCPFCRHEAEASAFVTPEQLAYAEQAAIVEVQRQLGLALGNMARGFNRRAPRGMITMRMEVSTTPVRIPLPPAAAELMTLRIACESCGCRFAVIGTGFFCPACGHNSAEQTFSQAVVKARAAVGALPTIRAAIADQDTSVQVTRDLIEGQIGNLVTAFQRFAEASYSRLPGPHQRPRRNAFQNLADGEQLWVSAGGRAYTATLSTSDMADLQRLFQQRHLLAHQQGIIDADYLSRSGDTHYAIGQRLVVREETVFRLADLVELLVSGMRKDLPLA